MKHKSIFNENVKSYDTWYDEYPEVFQSEVAAVKEHFFKLPENIKGIEIGVGTGRFCQALDIKEGVDPSIEMATVAAKRGIEVVEGYAENLPYKDLHFDFVLFVTVCHLDNVKEAFKEAYRVLKRNGTAIIGFIDKEQAIGKEYEEKRKKSTFFRYATFYSPKYISKTLTEIGFKNLEFTQTLFGSLNDIKKVEIPKEGFGEGSFVVVSATKK